MNDLITVIVPVYKVENYLDQCVQSIIGQTYDNLEIILIDDGSSDYCNAMCDYWAIKDDRVKVIHKENGGLSSARNAGLDICKGAYITFIDSDDWVEKDYASTLLGAIIDNNADISSGSFILHDEITGNIGEIRRENFIVNSEQALLKLYNQGELPVFSHNKLYSAYIWNKLRFPVGHNYEDAYTTYLAINHANVIIQISDCLYNYRLRSGSIMASKFSLSCIDRAYAWKENYLFCKEKYPSVAPYAQAYWLEHIPPLLSKFPSKMTEEEAKAKAKLRKEIRGNIGFILTKMPLKKTYYQLKALLLD